MSKHRVLIEVVYDASDADEHEICLASVTEYAQKLVDLTNDFTPYEATIIKGGE